MPRTRCDSCDLTQIAEFEAGTRECVNCGLEEGALVDLGTGFWAEHQKLWDMNHWCQITTELDEKTLVKVIDRHVMRQLVMTGLQIGARFDE
jgi:hypothetical protein